MVFSHQKQLHAMNHISGLGRNRIYFKFWVSKVIINSKIGKMKALILEGIIVLMDEMYYNLEINGY